ncbi:hypothetical protein OG413_40970 [Streptomyces sp. NBC_01433]|uniref:hypothetical protein n=1 Tax=Streptomyces sp. NBC_01433 TaxID=2903864 RepID=UPI002250404A|nr:hypothetical protein [Streptomyces sp. NBC_01433]MCX4681576.1 hypothetical protein [Streptomyces sp. NBC_01433]
MQHTPVSDRSAAELLAQAHGAEHAATLALNAGHYRRAQAHAFVGRLRIYLYEIALSNECRDCSGDGITARSCAQTDCEEATRGSTHHMHWEPCLNRATHRSPVIAPVSGAQAPPN